MSAPDDQPAAPRPSTGPPICDDRRADPAHPRRLEFEALVATTASREQTPRLIVEQRAIAALCHNLLSIAEVAARLHLPLGVTRLLVGDMADEDLVVIYRPAQPGDRPDRALLKRVLDGAATNRQPACGSPAAAQRHLGSGPMAHYPPVGCTRPCRHPA